MPRRNTLSRTINLDRLQFTNFNEVLVSKLKEKISKLPNQNYKGLKIEQDNLVYQEPQILGGKTYTIIPSEKKQEFLKEYYNSPETGFWGLDTLHKNIKQKYIGISYNDVQEFLGKQQVHQQTIQPRRPVLVKAVTASAPNHHW